MKRIVLGVAIIVGAVMANPVQSAVAGTNPIPSIQIENQSEVVRNKEQKRTDLEARKVELNREIDNLKLDISELETLISQKNTEIEAIEEALIKSEAVEQESSDDQESGEEQETESSTPITSYDSGVHAQKTGEFKFQTANPNGFMSPFA